MAQGADIAGEIGGYRPKALVGQGGMGIVYLAEEVGTGRKAALKLLTPNLARDDSFRQRFVRESRYANSIRHPNIIEFYGAGEANGTLYMAMQYVEGTDLKALLARDGRLPADRAVHFLSQIAAALDAAHAGGLLHRDVKPGNIMIASGDGPEPAGHCYLADFGLSKNPSSDSIALTAAGEFVGTVDYNAPEQILGQPPDHRVDVYALGCVLYEALTGTTPFQKARGVEVLYAHMQDPPPLVSDKRTELPPGIDAVIARAMAKAPEDRYESCSALMDAARSELAPVLQAAAADGSAGPATGEGAGGGGGAGAGSGETADLETGAEGELVLEIAEGPAAGRTIKLGDELVIGRQAGGAGRIADDLEISREHARIARDPDGRLVIEDLGSTNGTFLNGLRLGGPEPLKPGDTINVGESTLRVERARAVPVSAPSAASPAASTVDLAVPPEAAEAERGDVTAAAPAATPPASAAGGDERAGDETAAAPSASAAEPETPPRGSSPPPAETPLAIETPHGKVALRVEVDLETGSIGIAIEGEGAATRFVRGDSGWTVEPGG